MTNTEDFVSKPTSSETGESVIKLPAFIENRLHENIDELAMAEGNIVGAAKNIKTIYITSCDNNEGKTTAAIQLAWSLTINGNSKILLVDGNPRNPELSDLFGIHQAPGISELVYSDAEPEQVLQKTAYKNLVFMAFGCVDVERPFLIQEGNFDKFDKVCKEFDYVIFDGNRLIGSSDSILISRLFDGVLLTVNSEETKHKAVLKVLEKLKNVNANVLGIVLNKHNQYIPKVLHDKK